MPRRPKPSAPVSLVGGSSTINTTTGTGANGTNILSLTTVSRTNGATLNVAAGGTIGLNDALGTTTNELLIGSLNSATPTSAAINGIIPWITIGSPGIAPLNFATYGTNGLAPNTNYVTSLMGAASTSNVILTDSTGPAQQRDGQLADHHQRRHRLRSSWAKAAMP